MSEQLNSKVEIPTEFNLEGQNGNVNTPQPQDLEVDYSVRDASGYAVADAKAAHLLEEYGAFVAVNFLQSAELQPVHDAISQLIALRFKQQGLTAVPDEDGITRFDDGFTQLNKHNRQNGGIIYDALPRLHALTPIAAHSEFRRLSSTLLKTDLLMDYLYHQIRIDHPNEDKFLFHWHQDFPYIMDSFDSLVYWIPMHDVDISNGALEIAVGSHKRGLLPMKVLENPSRKGGLKIEISDPSVIDEYPHIQIPVKAGSVLVFSTMLLHASGPNRSTRARWSLQLRHGNWNHPEAVQRGWPRDWINGGDFTVSYPEYVTNLNDPNFFHWVRS